MQTDYWFVMRLQSSVSVIDTDTVITVTATELFVLYSLPRDWGHITKQLSNLGDEAELECKRLFIATAGVHVVANQKN